jgi:phage head maturation protease
MSSDHTFETTASTVFEVNRETRTIRGLVVPFGVVGQNGSGKFIFDDATEFSWPADLTRLKLTYPGHDLASPTGYATELSKTPEGIVGAFKIARGPKGDEALSAAEDHTYDGLSMGLAGDAIFENRSGVQRGRKAPIQHVALTPAPAFDDARVTSVTASAVPNGKESVVADENKTEAPTVDLATLQASVDALTAKFDANQAEIPPREPNPQTFTQTKVTEPLPYVFDGQAHEHDFSSDLIAGLFQFDGEAKGRVQKFLGAVNFAGVATGDVDEINPHQVRTDLYVDQIQAGTPVLDALRIGGLSDSTPFIVPKFNTATNYIADHTEGTEPTNDATFTTTSQTVTPAAVSGKGALTREVVDAGGNPKVSALLWTQFQREYLKNLEAKAAAFINGLTLTELGTVLDSSDEATTPGTIAKLFEQNLAALLFVDGGENFQSLLVPQDIWTPIVNVRDADGRPMYPIKNPTNANGSLGARYRSLEIGGFNLTPAKSLGTTADKAYVFDKAFGGVWHSGATQIALPETVANGYVVGIFGYVASAMLDTNKIRKITLQA